MRRGVGGSGSRALGTLFENLVWMSLLVRQKWEGLCGAAETIQVTNPQFN